MYGRSQAHPHDPQLQWYNEVASDRCECRSPSAGLVPPQAHIRVPGTESCDTEPVSLDKCLEFAKSIVANITQSTLTASQSTLSGCSVQTFGTSTTVYYNAADNPYYLRDRVPIDYARTGGRRRSLTTMQYALKDISSVALKADYFGRGEFFESRPFRWNSAADHAYPTYALVKLSQQFFCDQSTFVNNAKTLNERTNWHGSRDDIQRVLEYGSVNPLTSQSR